MRRIWKILVVLIPALVIVAAAAVALRRERLAAYLVPIVESQLSRSLGREVRVGGISGDLVHGAVLHDVRIAEGRGRFSHRPAPPAPLLRVKRLAVRYRLGGLLFGAKGAAALDRVDVTGARLNLARDRLGRWNIAPLLKPRVPAGRFTGTINIADSKVMLADHLAPAPLKRPLRMTFTRLAGRVVSNPEAGVAFRLDARAPAAGGQQVGADLPHIAASGSASGGRILLNVVAPGINLAHWQRRTSVRWIRFLGGDADLRVTGVVARRSRRPASRSRRWGFDYQAQAQVRDSTVLLGSARQPLRHVSGPLMIARGQVRLAGLTGAIGSGRFRASGAISNTGARHGAPTLNLVLSGDQVTPQAAAALFNLRLPAGLTASPLGFDLSVTGGSDHAIVRGEVRAHQVRYQRAPMPATAGPVALTARDVKTEVVYRDGMVWLKGVQGQTLGGGGGGDAWIDLTRGRVSAAFEGQGQGLEIKQLLAALGAESARQVEGAANAHLAGTYDERGAHGAGTIEVGRGRVGRFNFTSGSGVAELTNGVIRVPSARLESPVGTVAAEGAIAGDGALDLRVRAGNIALGRIARLAGLREAVRGVGYFAGTVSGSLSEPRAAGALQVLDAGIAGKRLNLGFDLISGAVTITRTSLTADRLVAYREGARLAVSGALRGLDRPPGEAAIAAHVDVSYAGLADLLIAAGMGAPSSGAPIRREESARSAGPRANDRAPKAAGPAADVQGDVEASVEVAGTLAAPTATGWARVHRPGWRGFGLDSAQAQFDLSGGAVRIQEAKAQAGGSQVTGSGEITTDGALRVKFAGDLQLADLHASAPGRVPLDLRGHVVADGEIGGTVERPVIAAQARSDRISVNGEEFTAVTAQLRPAPAGPGGAGEPSQPTEVEVSFSQGEGRFALSGWADPAARMMNLNASLAGGSLGRLRSAVQAVAAGFRADSPVGRVGRALAHAPAPWRGKLDVAATVSGWRRPGVEINAQLSDASVAAAPIPNATATIALRGSEVEIRHFEARQGPAYAMARGTISLHGRLAVDVDAFNLHAGLFEPWLGLKNPISGSADVSAALSGTLDQPQAVGSIEVTNLAAGGVRVDNLRIPRFEVRGQSLVAEDMVAALGPHIVHASAAIPFSWAPLRLDAARPLSAAIVLNGQDLALLTRLLPAIAEASGSLDGGVTLGGAWRSPRLAGAITVSRGVLRLREPQALVTGLEGGLRFDGGRTMIVDNLTGRWGDGSLLARGKVELLSLLPSQVMENRFDLRITGAGLPVSLSPLFKGKVNMDLALTSPTPGGAPPASGAPLLQGQVVLASGEMGLPQRGIVRSAARMPFDPRLEVQVSFAPSLWLRTPTISMQVSGVGRIGGRFAAPTASAMVESRRGTVDLPAAHFRITYASVEAAVSPPSVAAPSAPPGAEVRAGIRLEAEANVRGYRVMLSMSGPLTDPKVQPKVTLTSVPALDEDRLWALVTGLPIGTVTPELGSRARAALTQGLGGMALYPLERAFARALGVQEFGVEYSQYEPLRIRVGGYVVQRLYGTYLRSVTGQIPEWDMVLAYEVLPALSLGVRINERNELLWEGQTTRRF